MTNGLFEIRGALETDLPDILRLEQTYFPPRAGRPHAGFAFAGTTSVPLLQNALRGDSPFAVTVATVQGRVAGFAMSSAWRAPGGAFDSRGMLLQYVAVDSTDRSVGIGKALVDEVAARAQRLKQLILLAHIPRGQRPFYEYCGWEVLGSRLGFAWIPRGYPIRADVPDAADGYPHMAVNILAPEAILATFSFKDIRSQPIGDALHELRQRVAAGKFDPSLLDRITQKMLAETRHNPPFSQKPRGAFGQRN